MTSISTENTDRSGYSAYVDSKKLSLALESKKSTEPSIAVDSIRHGHTPNATSPEVPLDFQTLLAIAMVNGLNAWVAPKETKKSNVKTPRTRHERTGPNQHGQTRAR